MGKNASAYRPLREAPCERPPAGRGGRGRLADAAGATNSMFADALEASTIGMCHTSACPRLPEITRDHPRFPEMAHTSAFARASYDTSPSSVCCDVGGQPSGMAMRTSRSSRSPWSSYSRVTSNVSPVAVGLTYGERQPRVGAGALRTGHGLADHHEEGRPTHYAH